MAEMIESGTSGIKTLAVLALLCGIWMIICPYAIHAGNGARVDDLIFGILAIIVAGARLGRPAASSVSWVNVIFGIWLLISPFVLGWTGGIRGNNVAAGILLIIFAAINTQLHSTISRTEFPTQRAA